MSILVKKIRYKIVQYFNAYILRDASALLALDWIRNDRRYDYRHRYDLPLKCVIFDCGGYKGEWSARMIELHPTASIWVFELVPEYSKFIEKRFYNNTSLQVCNFGLGSSDKDITITVDELASSAYTRAGSHIVISKIKDIVQFNIQNNIERVHLLKMNIEGGEYELLERIIESNTVIQYDNIQIQFHNYGESFVEERERLRGKLELTHYLTYDYKWIFENWRLK